MLKVRCSPVAYEASVLAVEYDDARHEADPRRPDPGEPDRPQPDGHEPEGPQPDGHEPDGHERDSRPPDGREPDGRRLPGTGRDGRPTQVESRQRQPNTLMFERLVGRSADRPRLGVRQAVSIGAGDRRRTVRARYDVLDDLSLLARSTGAGCCGHRTPGQGELPLSRDDVRGLVLLHVVTDGGRLVVEEVR